MELLDKIKNYIEHPDIFKAVVLNHFGLFIKDDEFFIRLKWKLRKDYPLNLDNPQTFSEKLQWLKLHDRNPEYIQMVDKYEAKKYVATIIGDQYIIPTFAVYDKVEDINFEELPNQFVLKCTHDSGGIVICKDKNNFDVKVARKRLNHFYHRRYYWQTREWPYKNIKPRIIAEKYMTDDGEELKDYKVFTFGGEPKMIEIDYNRYKGHQRNLYTTDWKRLNVIIKFPTDEKRDFEKPKVLDELLDLSRKLSSGIPHVRVDFYIISDKIYFGEMTFYHGSGMEKITPKKFDYEMGEWLKLPIEK